MPRSASLPRVCTSIMLLPIRLCKHPISTRKIDTERRPRYVRHVRRLWEARRRRRDDGGEGSAEGARRRIDRRPHLHRERAVPEARNPHPGRAAHQARRTSASQRWGRGAAGGGALVGPSRVSNPSGTGTEWGSGAGVVVSAQPTRRLRQSSSIRGLASSSCATEMPNCSAIRQHTSPGSTMYFVGSGGSVGNGVGIGSGGSKTSGMWNGSGVTTMNGSGVSLKEGRSGSAPSSRSQAMAP